MVQKLQRKTTSSPMYKKPIRVLNFGLHLSEGFMHFCCSILHKLVYNPNSTALTNKNKKKKRGLFVEKEGKKVLLFQSWEMHLRWQAAAGRERHGFTSSFHNLAMSDAACTASEDAPARPLLVNPTV